MAHHGLYPKGQASYSFCFMSKVKQQRKPTTTPPTKKKKTTQKIQYLLVKAPYEYRFVVILFNHNIIKWCHWFSKIHNCCLRGCAADQNNDNTIT